MGARRTEVRRLQEMVRLHRMGEGSREVARQLRMGRDTIPCYLRRLRRAGLLEGSAEDLPTVCELRAGVGQHAPAMKAAVHVSTGDRWRESIRRLRRDKGGPNQA